MKYATISGICALACAAFTFVAPGNASAQESEPAQATVDDVGQSQEAETVELENVSPGQAGESGDGDLETATVTRADDSQDGEAESVTATKTDDSGDDELELIQIDQLPQADDENYDDVEEVDDAYTLVTGQSPRESNLEELRRSFELYKSAIANASYDEADTLAKRMVELSIRLYGLDSNESAKALTNLGLVQQRNQEYDSAILNFQASIGIIERTEDRLNSALISPLRGLAASQLGSGRPDMARQTYDRAVHVSHVNEGPHNLMQIDVLEELAETYLTMGEREEALDIHQVIYNLEARNTDLKSEDIIPALERQAEWLNRMRMHDKERMTWRRIIKILEDARGKGDLSLIEPLTGLGKSYLFVSEFEVQQYTEVSTATGDTYLRRALRIAEENEESTWSVKQQSLLALADYYTLSERATKARRIYAETWTLLSEDEERLHVRAEQLERPKVLKSIFPPKYYNSSRSEEPGGPPDSFDTGKIVVGYRITRRGSTRDIKILEVDPPGLDDMEYSVAREMSRLVHRPRMVDGETVDTKEQTFTHEFYYRESDLPIQEEGDDAMPLLSQGS